MWKGSCNLTYLSGVQYHSSLASLNGLEAHLRTASPGGPAPQGPYSFVHFDCVQSTLASEISHNPPLCCLTLLLFVCSCFSLLTSSGSASAARAGLHRAVVGLRSLIVCLCSQPVCLAGGGGGTALCPCRVAPPLAFLQH